MAWTDEMVSDLRNMWADGKTTGEIAKILGVSKNSIIGKVHRLGLSGRPSPIKKKNPDGTVTPLFRTKRPEDKVSAKRAAQPKPQKEEKKAEKQPVKVEVKKEAPAPKKEEKKEYTPKDMFTREETFMAPIIKADTPKSADGLVRLVDLDMHTCRWPVGDPKDEKFHFCGKKIRAGQTYCDEHSEMAYVKQHIKGRVTPAGG